MVPGVGPHRFKQLVVKFGTPDAVLAARLDELYDTPLIPRGVAKAIAEADVAGAERICDQVAELGGTVLIPDDDRFPPLLREISDPPLVLFALGRLDLLQQPAVAIVGPRSHTRYGAEVCRHFAGGLARAGLVVVSGMARGIDAIAHTAALDARGGTVGVLGNGLGVVYPEINRALYRRVAADGCLLTEFPPGQKPEPGSFPQRNRLISGLTRVTIVVEASTKSGALLTAAAAVDQGRDLLVVPGPITSPLSAGCNRLIQTGAKPALGLRDVLEEYGIATPGVPSAALPTDLTPAERSALEALGDDEAQVDDIAARLGTGAAETMAVLTSLEIRGLVTQAPGKIFSRKRLALDAETPMK